MKNGFLVTLAWALLCFFSVPGIGSAAGPEERGQMNIFSPAFISGGMIPEKYTCDGRDISPPLRWNGCPTGTASFALVCEDPDAPGGTWVHWVYYDIPAGTRELPEKVPPQRSPPAGGTQGVNDFHRIGYGGPCPPGGTHRYFFRLYALDAVLNLGPGLTKRKLLGEIEGHVLGKAYILGKYGR